MNKLLLLIVLVAMVSACSSVNIRTDNKREANSAPSYQQRFSYWFWGLKGSHSINVREVCMGKPVAQMQAVNTITDSLIYIATIGIYSPRTARVWCAGEDA